jgi:hypothetical protein
MKTQTALAAMSLPYRIFKGYKKSRATLSKISSDKLTNEALTKKKKVSVGAGNQQVQKLGTIGTKKVVAKKAAPASTSRLAARERMGSPTPVVDNEENQQPKL